ncbi:hypothetical protein EDF56_106308 [Novosphingobium sp. PhB165]|uniref:hypothetical protein n=1 Tax=Novosphingobium sp. PhB165 TaxID=2485105 RepID=UPI0010D3B652|nr:hypothetical protein [Novosphingobium sp. PhB165]TCM17192.1 hypothetical protein EDF56_106308 [Novosphingobium sp. PhB165]
MKDKTKLTDDLIRELNLQCSGYGGIRNEELVPADSRLRQMGRVESPAERGPFGRWLVRQQAAKGLLARLVSAANADPKFPLDGDPEAVRDRLRTCGADGNMFAAIDDAELDWLSL